MVIIRIADLSENKIDLLMNQVNHTISPLPSAGPGGWRFQTSYLSLPDCFYARVQPVPVRAPRLVLLNERLASELGLDPGELRNGQSAIFAGNQLPPGATPLAQAYAGHQFGHFTKLGDGRAIVLGEHVTDDGRRVDVQLKGSGQTPFSRRGDGRAVLGPMLREYIISEAMYALGIPTTRSLAVAATGEPVFRETPLPGAVLTRVATSHIRVGTFQYAAVCGRDTVQALIDHTIQRHYPDCAQAENPAAALLAHVVERQAELIARWMLVGFIHGVMNTDNMAISGETIDYGPCAFMNAYDPATVFSSIDARGRYAYGNQPQIALWNLARFAGTLLPFLHKDQDQAVAQAESILDRFPALYHSHWLTGMRRKLGWEEERDGDEDLILELLKWMQANQVDYTSFFVDYSESGETYSDADFQAWYQRWQQRSEQESNPPEQRLALMHSVNPVVIPRNHLVEAALLAAQAENDLEPTWELLHRLQNPYQREGVPAKYREPGSPDPDYCTYCGT